mgnify:CR=1 FL=1
MTPAAATGPTPAHYGVALAGIITGGDDYGSYPPHAPQKMLHGWGIQDRDSAINTIESMLASDASGDALVFDRVRAAHLARAAAGATYLDQEASWALVQRASIDVQRANQSWHDVGSAYIRAKNGWLQGRGLDTADGTESNVEKLSSGVWLGVPFGMPLIGDPHLPQAVDIAAAGDNGAMAAMGGFAVASVGGALKQNAENRAERAMWRTIRSYVPRILHPLIPGYSDKSAVQIYKEWIKKYIWGVVVSAIISLAVFALVGGILGLTFVYVVYLVITL